MGEQAVAAGHVHDTASAEQASRASRHVPRFVQLLARKAARVADGAGQTVEQCVRGKASEVVVGEPGLGRQGERHDAPIVLEGGSERADLRGERK